MSALFYILSYQVAMLLGAGLYNCFYLVDLMSLFDYSEYDFFDLLKGLMTIAVRHQAGVAVWRLPKQRNIQVIIDTSFGQQSKNLTEQPHLSGFAISPFINLGSKVYLLEMDIQFEQKDGFWNINYQKPSGKTDLFLRELDRLLTDKSMAPNGLWHINREKSLAVGADRTSYTNLVSEAITKIQTNALLKVVVSRQKQIPFSDVTHPVDIFKLCLDRYNFGMVSLISVPGLGTWTGASPEILVSLDKQHIFKTMALAGTQKIAPGSSGQPDDKSPTPIVWSQKDREEQGMVSQFIKGCFANIGLNNYQEIGPKTVTAYDIVHLQTEFQLQIPDNQPQDLPFKMLEQLHPTSAVCGMAREPALEFIRAKETMDRQLYSGYLGPVNLFGESHLFVNLRCVQFFKTLAALYAGAGITGDSVPETEWLETEIKMQAMVEIFQELAISRE
jgi:isochorismate synthase